MKTIIKIALLTFLFKSTNTRQNATAINVKDVCSVDILSGIGNENLDKEIIRYIVPVGDYGLEQKFVNHKRVVQVWMPVHIIETPENGFSYSAN